jgi:HAD superfamily hydrolase (TIGR01459 family)
MSEILTTLDAVSDRYDALLCDVWGVLHNGRAIFPAAAAALQRFRAKGGRVVLLTNAPKPRDPIPAQLDRLHCPRDAWDVIVTSGDATRHALKQRAPGMMFAIGDAGDDVLWQGLGLARSGFNNAAFIAVAGLDDPFSENAVAQYAEMLAEAKTRGLDMICANPDIVVRVGERLMWCAGALAREYEALGGRVIMAGKPHAPIYDLAYEELSAFGVRDRTRLLAVGDGVITDVRGANLQGLDCLFIAAGIHGAGLLSAGALDPTKVDAALTAEGAHARYAMAGLA